MEYLHTFIQHYWKRWRIKYLKELPQVDTPINVGRIVLVEDLVLNPFMHNVVKWPNIL